MPGFDPGAVLRDLAADPRHGRLVHVHEVPARRARGASMPGWVAPQVGEAFARQGVAQLWGHQARSAQAAWEGRHVVVATGTASGKSVGYLLPALTAIVAGGAWPRRATALYLSPTKALAGDQAARVEALGVPGVRVATYDGDTPADERAWVRRNAGYVLTNPDMLHHGILPGHTRWASFFSALSYVVVDECHAYRGVFGSHVAATLRRLRRVAAHYGAEPTFVFASATAADPAEHAERLSGLPVEAITQDDSPRGAMTFALIDPEAPDGGERPSTLTRSAALLAHLVGAGVQTAAFARSRSGVEVVAQAARSELERHGVGAQVAAYRGGYLPEERRALEADLRSGRLRGVATTSALEVGVDIAGLDAVVLAGWPGRRASLWQRAGRAGRAGGNALAVLVAGDDPLDAYLVHHPEAIFGPEVEATVVDPGNPHVLAPHLAAAAAEVPLTVDDEGVFGPGFTELVEVLAARGLLRRRPTGWYWTREERPADLVTLRGTGENVTIVEQGTGRIVGTVDAPRADASVHPGAVHLHQQRPYVVTELDLEASTAVVVPGDPGWSTQARSVSSFDVLSVTESVDAGALGVRLGAVAVRSQVTSFLRRLPTGEVLGEHPLDLPRRTLTTRAVWWTLPPEALEAVGVGAQRVPGAAHAAEHAAIGLLPLLATADRWDIGGVSTALHPDTGLPTIMVYDGHPGGAGFAERGFRVWREWMARTRQVVAECRCASGCPSCVQSPKCGNGNEPLDKAGAVALLGVALAEFDRHAPPADEAR